MTWLRAGVEWMGIGFGTRVQAQRVRENRAASLCIYTSKICRKMEYAC
jgi:hypothetical protein